MKIAVLVVAAWAVGACAEASPKFAGGGVDAGGGPDSSVVDEPDARAIPGTPDAAIPDTPDAFVPPGPVDAAPPPPPPVDAGSGIFCETNADCTAADDCCFVALCVPGTELGDLCFPD
jgi:hypothetical protein